MKIIEIKPETGLAMCRTVLVKKAMGKGKQPISEVFKISVRIGKGFGKKFTIFHRSACITNRLADRPVKSDGMKSSANYSSTRTGRTDALDHL